jgi:formylglycine-generating enzyme required for sulfatase activity
VKRALYLATAAGSIALASCLEREPSEQWLVMVFTDAPLPQFGDRLLLEVLDDEGAPACEGCRHQVGLDETSSWPLSFGVERHGGRLHVRARLFRSATAGPDGQPRGSALIDQVGRLPPLPEGEKVTVVFNLSMNCFGMPSHIAPYRGCDPDTARPADDHPLPRAGAAPTLRAGAWAPAREAPCASPAPEGMVCIPGGVFLLGTPVYLPLRDDGEEAPEHLVKVSPYFLDRDEVSVGTVRRLVEAGHIERPAVYGGANTRFCLYDGAAPDAPMNCAPFRFARDVCEALGKRLPWEAEWEYAAGNRGRESTWPWGDDDDVCDRANVARGDPSDRYGDETFGDSSCLRGSSKYGPLAFKAPNDVTELGVRNMAGSLDEWVADEFEPYASSFWTPPPGSSFLENPRCQSSQSRPGRRLVRGGSWAMPPYFSRATYRGLTTNNGWSGDTGIRCAL